MPKYRFAHLKTLAQLQAERRRLNQQMDQHEEQLTQLLHNWPVALVKGGAEMVAGAVVQRVFGSRNNKQAGDADTYTSQASADTPNLTDQLKSAGLDTLQYGISKVLDMLINKEPEEQA